MKRLAAFLFFMLVLLTGIAFSLNPSAVCAMPAGMTCVNAYLSSETDTLNITLVNGLQKTIVITNMSCTKSISYSEPVHEIEMALGQSSWFVMACSDENGKLMKFEPTEDFSGRINIGYYSKNEGKNASRKISGDVYIRTDRKWPKEPDPPYIQLATNPVYIVLFILLAGGFFFRKHFGWMYFLGGFSWPAICLILIFPLAGIFPFLGVLAIIGLYLAGVIAPLIYYYKYEKTNQNRFAFLAGLVLGTVIVFLLLLYTGIH